MKTKCEEPDSSSINYKDHYIYKVKNNYWRVKKDKDDSFALHDGYLATVDDAKRFVDDR